MQWLFLKPQRLETLAHSTREGPQVSEVLPNLGVRTLLPPVRPTEAGTTKDLQTPSPLSASGQPWGAVLTKAVSNPPFLPCDKYANLAICKMLCKKENAMEPLVVEKKQRLSIEKTNL